MNDLWILTFDSASQIYTWTENNAINPPPHRTEASMIINTYNGKIILFGGQGLTGNGYLNDTWELSFDSTSQTYTWTNITPTTINSSNTPPASSASSMVFDPSSGYAVLFGGGSSNSVSNNTWLLGSSPQITSPNAASFITNTIANFTVTTTGYPVSILSEIRFSSKWHHIR